MFMKLAPQMVEFNLDKRKGLFSNTGAYDYKSKIAFRLMERNKK